MHRGKTLISHIDSGERKRIEGTRQFEMPNYRSGDVLEVTMFNSLSEGTFNTFTGVIYANKMRKNLRHSFKMNTIVDSVNTSIMFKAHSPMIGKVSLVKYGSNQLRNKMNQIPDLNLSKNRLKEPVIKGKGYKHRNDIGQKQEKRKASQESTRGRAQK